VFARKGFHDATVKEIAATAEFSVGGVYSFFDEKDDIFVGVFLWRGAEFMDGMRRVLGEPSAPRDAMHRLADYQVRFFREHPSFGKLFLRSSGVTLGDLDSKIDRTQGDNLAEAMNLQAKLFRSGQDAGELRDGDPEVLAMLFSGIVSAYQASDPLVVGSTIGTERMSVAELHEVLDGAFSTGS
jgi:AcrR family transcriptional regulator